MRRRDYSDVLNYRQAIRALGGVAPHKTPTTRYLDRPPLRYLWLRRVAMRVFVWGLRILNAIDPRIVRWGVGRWYHYNYGGQHGTT